MNNFGRLAVKVEFFQVKTNLTVGQKTRKLMKVELQWLT